MARTDILYDYINNDLDVSSVKKVDDAVDLKWNISRETTSVLVIPVSFSIGQEIYARIPYFGSYEEFECSCLPGVECEGNVFGKIRKIYASELPLVSIGTFLLRWEEDNVIRFYSGKDCDFDIGDAKPQNTSMTVLCSPGDNYRFPTFGAGSRRFINGIQSSENLKKKVIEQLSVDGVNVINIDYNESTQQLNIETEER